jgi:hypothetical protein
MPNPIPERPKVDDPIAWGNLVKSWAKGEKPHPKTLTEFRDQCATANVGLKLPSYIDDFDVVQRPKNVFLLRLPAKELVKESEDFLDSGGDYQIPQFYNVRYGVPLVVDQPQKRNFHAERVGDYTIGLCQ